MNENYKEIRKALKKNGFLQQPKAYAVVDGQFGSTGKGLAVEMLQRLQLADGINVLSNAGPNSGHTSYYGDKAQVLMQLPTYAVQEALMKPEKQVTCLLTDGAIVDPARLIEEVERYPNLTVWVSHVAAVVTDEVKADEQTLVDRIGSTGKGTGAALASKIMRGSNVAMNCPELSEHPQIGVGEIAPDEPFYEGKVPQLLEVSQGFSLGLNQEFYPHCTSRECTVTQAILDAKIHPHDYKDCMMVVRTFPIRVAGNSGPGYRDQKEITWEDVGVEPEFTTVTKKQRRVFTWSDEQFASALFANRPSVIFVNFCNYLSPDWATGNTTDARQFVHNSVVKPYMELMGKEPVVIMGYGPKSEDARLFDGVPF